MAAMRAMPSTSPFLAEPERISARVSGFMRIVPAATAMRWVSCLAPTSTMWAWPVASKWVSGLILVGGRCHVVEEEKLRNGARR